MINELELSVTVVRPADESLLINPLRRADAPVAAIDDDPIRFHRTIPGYAPTPLLDAPQSAEAIGAKKLLVKRETERFGLPAFKILGASWATARALNQVLEARGLAAPGATGTFADLVEAVKPLKPMTLCCATDGNHGRAVARMAAWLGFDSRIYVPEEMAPARIAAIAGEGADVIPLAGTYDDAIARSAEDASENCLVISDTSWTGYSDIPGWVIDGYGTMFSEVDQQLDGAGVDVVAIQLGVGALGAATAAFARRHDAQLVGVEPVAAACNFVSLEAGQIVLLPGPHDSIMAGLNCGLSSEIAWPIVSGNLDLALAIDDRRAEDAMRVLAADGVVAGETGSAGLAGLIAWTDRFGGDLTGKRVLIVTTEGPTDPEAYQQIVGN